MRIFMTGATGFIGSFLVAELINAGHHVVGLSRSDAGAEMLTRAGAWRGPPDGRSQLLQETRYKQGAATSTFASDPRPAV